MEHFLAAIEQYVHEHWIKFLVAALFMGIGWYIGRRRATAEWRQKQFFGRLNISLNMLKEGHLRIRTIVEKRCDEIFLNSVASETVSRMARKTTEKNPILPLAKDDYWSYLNAVLNEVSERFAPGQLKQDLGLPVTKDRYLICLTSENAGAIRTRKVRAMLIKKKILEELPEEEPKFESANHITRWETIKLLSSQYRKHPEQFLEMEIAV